MSENNKNLSNTISEIRHPDSLRWVVNTQVLLWGCSQDVGWGYSYVKSWVELGNPLPRRVTYTALGTRPQFLSIWAFFYDMVICFPLREQWEREGERRKLQPLLNLILEVAYHRSCHILLAPQSNFSTMWILWGCSYQKMEIIKGLLGVWPPHMLSKFRAQATQAYYHCLTDSHYLVMGRGMHIYERCLSWNNFKIYVKNVSMFYKHLGGLG